jgi:PPM family protein phosphatase
MREARAGDRYLLCSDGLSGVVSEETLAEALKDPDPQTTADRLIELALRSGGPDNITVIVADVVDDDGRGVLMEPVVDGAAGDNVGQRQLDARSAAGRAALADRAASAAPPTPTPPPGGGPPARRRPLRLILVAVALLVVLVAGAFGTYSWALTHWFVATTGTGTSEDVAVFRGLDVSVVGFDLHKVDHDTGLAVADLTPAARSRVRAGIPANDKADADRILTALRDQRLPLCTLAPGPTAPASGHGAAATSGAPASSGTPASSGAPATTAPRTTAPRPTGTSPVTTAATGSASRTTTESTDTPVPGVDCREVK